MSLRWVQVLAPRNSARTPARSESRVRPPRRPALAAASGHSNQGRTCGVAVGLQHGRGGDVDPSDHGVLVHHGLALVVDVGVAEVGVDREDRPAVHREHVDAAASPHPVDGQGARELVPRQRIVAAVERRRGGPRHHRRVVLGEALHDRAAGLPARAQIGLLEHRESGRRGLLQRLALLLVGPRARLCARVLRRVARDQGGDRQVVEQLVDGTADDVVARAGAIDLAGDRGVDRGAEAGRRGAPDELFETWDRRGRGDRGDALRVDEVDRRLDHGGVEHPGRAVDLGQQVAAAADEHELGVDAVRPQDVDAGGAAHRTGRSRGDGVGRFVGAVTRIECEARHGDAVPLSCRARRAHRRAARACGRRARGRGRRERRAPIPRPP